MARNDPLDITNQGLAKTYQERKTVSFDGTNANGAIPVSEVKATATLTSDATNVTDGDTVTIDSIIYRFKDTLAQAYDVKIGGSAAVTLDNLKAAINATGTPGTEYFAGTLVHPTVTATTNTNTTQVVEALTAGASANAIVTTEASTHLSWGGGTLAGGVTAVAGDPVPLFTVTGDVRITDFAAVCSEDLVGATATLAIGIAGNTGALVAATTATDIDTSEVWVDTAPATVESSIVGKVLASGADIIGTIATAAITDGTIKFYIEFIPLSADGDVRAT